MSFRGLALLVAVAVPLAAQSKRSEDLAVGKILVTTRGALDPAFSESVILLVHRDESGALGLMINRRTTIPISRALKDLAGAAHHSDPIFLGGPVELDAVFALSRAVARPAEATGVAGKTYLLSSKAALQKALAGATDASEFRVYAGYCGWAPHQLENEVTHGAWYIFNGNEELTFDSKPETLWTRLIGRVEAQVARADDGPHATSIPASAP